MSLVETARGRFFVRDTGGKGVAVLMLHGWPESSACWEASLPYLNQACRWIRPDTRGMGKSERTLAVDAYQKQALALDMLAVLDALGVETCIVVGHDWGGIIAQEIALAAPQRVLGLVLLNISLINNTTGQERARAALLEKGGMRFLWYQFFQQQPELAEAMITGNERVWLSHFLRLSQARVFPEALLDEYEQGFKIPNTATTSANYYRAMHLDMRRWQGLQQPFAMPGLFIYGVKDVVIVPEYLIDMDKCFAQGVDIVKLDAGHFVQDELPMDVANAIKAFVEPYMQTNAILTHEE